MPARSEARPTQDPSHPPSCRHACPRPRRHHLSLVLRASAGARLRDAPSRRESGKSWPAGHLTGAGHRTPTNAWPVSMSPTFTKVSPGSACTVTVHTKEGLPFAQPGDAFHTSSPSSSHTDKTTPEEHVPRASPSPGSRPLPLPSLGSHASALGSSLLFPGSDIFVSFLF